MFIRLYALLVFIILLAFPGTLEAQENLEPEHACFILEDQRVQLLVMASQPSAPYAFKTGFRVKTDWSGKQVFVRMPPLRAPSSLWINGFKYGSDPGSGTAAEYNLSPFLKGSENDLGLEIMWPPEEDSLFTTPTLLIGSLLIRDPLHVRDLVTSVYPGSGDDEKIVRLQIFLKSYLQKRSQGHNLLIQVRDPGGELVFQQSRPLKHPLSFGQETEMIVDFTLEDPLLWLPGSPNLYELMLSMNETGDEGDERISMFLAIKSFEVADSILIQKGDRIPLIFAPDDFTKRLPELTEKEIRAVLEKHDFNAIRGCHPLSCEREALFLREGILVLDQVE